MITENSWLDLIVVPGVEEPACEIHRQVDGEEMLFYTYDLVGAYRIVSNDNIQLAATLAPKMLAGLIKVKMPRLMSRFEHMEINRKAGIN